MIALIQGVLEARVTVAGNTVGEIGPGLLALVAPPDEAERLFNEVVALARCRHHEVATSEFGAEMTVSLVNHGPVTLRLTA